MTIVRQMSTLKITDILLSYSLKIVATYPLSVKEMDCYSQIGLRVVGCYYYHLYSGYKEQHLLAKTKYLSFSE